MFGPVAGTFTWPDDAAPEVYPVPLVGLSAVLFHNRVEKLDDFETVRHGDGLRITNGVDPRGLSFDSAFYECYADLYVDRLVIYGDGDMHFIPSILPLLARACGDARITSMIDVYYSSEEFVFIIKRYPDPYEAVRIPYTGTYAGRRIIFTHPLSTIGIGNGWENEEQPPHIDIGLRGIGDARSMEYYMPEVAPDEDHFVHKPAARKVRTRSVSLNEYGVKGPKAISE